MTEEIQTETPVNEEETIQDVTHQGHGLEENRVVGIAEEDWLNFWFKPQLFLDESWFADIDARLLNRASSSLAWHISYQYVCDCLRLPTEYQEAGEGLAYRVIQDLMQQDHSIIDVATMMVSSVNVDAGMSTELKRKILQRNRALSLKKRFADACEDLAGRDYGVYFLYLAIMLETPSLWRRVRLMFPRQTVQHIEAAGKKVVRTEANSKAVRRAWNEIYSLKAILRPSSAVDNYVEPIVDEQVDSAAASNDVIDAQQAVLDKAG